jgi:glycolate oxidase FAD binding subunit
VDLDLLGAEREVGAAVAEARVVDPVGSRTHREVGGPQPVGTEVRAPTGVVTYDPAELTITVGAGTTVAELNAVLGAAGQECPLDPRDSAATIGGTLACGLSGWRRLRYGPLRDRVLEVRFANADGQLVRGGGPTVKNVTGYDMPRLLVGSLGTLGVLTRVILRCQPRPLEACWGRTDEPPDEVRARCFGPSAVLWDGVTTSVLLEGHVDDVAQQCQQAGVEPLDVAPRFPDGVHRGRASVSPARVAALGRALGALDGVRWLAESGVGTVHVACDREQGLAAARQAAETAGGWLLREAGAPGLDGFGIGLPNAALMTRIKHGFDPHGKLAPGRLPFTLDAREAASS